MPCEYLILKKAILLAALALLASLVIACGGDSARGRIQRKICKRVRKRPLELA